MLEHELLDLLHDLSLEEKLGQLLQLDGNLFCDDISFETGPASKLGFNNQDKLLCGSVLNISGAARVKEIQAAYMKEHPHKIPLLFMLDVINGYRTVFPIPLAQGCTFAPSLVEEIASITAKEVSTDGVHVDFSPMSDLVSDCRWGRVMESTGEDPYLNSVMTAAAVTGYQGKELEQYKIAACMKHFAGYGSPVAGREYNTVELSTRTLFDDHMKAYQAGIDAGCKLVMTSFNTLDRIPSTANKHLLQDILRKQMGFDGVVISDYYSVAELINHGIAADNKEAGKLAFEAGVDIDMCSTCYVRHLPELLQDSSLTDITEEAIDEAVLRVLRLKNELGLFENPYRDADEEVHNAVILSKAHRELAYNTAVRSFVLLKNEEELLPLSKHTSTAYIGPYADNHALHGAWSHQGKPEDIVTIKDGVQCYEPNAIFANGCSLLPNEEEIYGFDGIFSCQVAEEEAERQLKEAIEAAKEADQVVLCLGEQRAQSGEGGSRVQPCIPPCQVELLKKIYEVNSNIILVVFSGRPLVLTEVEPLCKAILEVWFPGVEGGNAIASVLYGDSEPGGRLSMSFPRDVGQMPMSYREFMTGRPLRPTSGKTRFVSRYQDCPNTPLYPFGYGLGYTTFRCSPITLDKEVMTKQEALHATVTITNEGKRTGNQIVQLYLCDLYGSVCRPKRELRDFTTITLAPQASTSVTFTITEPMLRFYDIDMNYLSEPGQFKLYIGFDCTTENEAKFTYR